jgi:hypothetical protein
MEQDCQKMLTASKMKTSMEVVIAEPCLTYSFGEDRGPDTALEKQTNSGLNERKIIFSPVVG